MKWRRMMIVALAVLSLVVIVLTWSRSAFFGFLVPASNSASVYNEPLVRSITNDDIAWECTFSGLIPFSSGACLELETNKDVTHVLALIELIDDPKRFAAAHMILISYFPKDAYPITLSPIYPFANCPPGDLRNIPEPDVLDYFGLKVEFTSAGGVSYAGTDRQMLREQWIRIAQRHGYLVPLENRNVKFLADDPGEQSARNKYKEFIKSVDEESRKWRAQQLDGRHSGSKE